MAGRVKKEGSELPVNHFQFLPVAVGLGRVHDHGQFALRIPSLAGQPTKDLDFDGFVGAEASLAKIFDPVPDGLCTCP